MSLEGPKARTFCAIDTADLDHAQKLARALVGSGAGVKLGKEFFAANGPDGVRRVIAAAEDAPLFLDLKFHDIPNTVAGAVRAATKLNPLLLNVHATGGPEMMRAAAEAAAQAGGAARPLVIAVTVLTSLDDDDLAAVGLAGPTSERALALALLAKQCGLDGVVCAPQEAARIRDACGDEFLRVTPGVRPVGAEAGDQKRVMTPGRAIAAGASYLVVGRPIAGAADPGEAARAIADDVQAAA